jgi:hypothetical protein
MVKGVLRGFAAIGARLHIVVVAVAIVLSGCASTFSGAPEHSLMPGRDLARLVIDTTLDAERIRNFIRCSSLKSFSTKDASGQTIRVECSGQPTGRTGYRNEIIYAQMAEITELYNAYELDISRELRKSGFLVSLVQIGLGSAGALVGEGASQILSAANAALTGADQAYSKEVLVESTIQAFQQQMRARRDAVKAQILRKTVLDTADYPLQAAVSDLADYRQAGTLMGALLGIAKDSSSTREMAGNNLIAAEKFVIDRRQVILTATAISILDYINELGEVGSARTERNGFVRDCFKATPSRSGLDFSDFLDDTSKHPQIVSSIIKCMAREHQVSIAVP